MTRQDRAKAYVIGAGLAGLSAATILAARGVAVTLIEAAGQAGGRCRSYFDPALDGVIDNGNHLVLSGNRAVHAYLDAHRRAGRAARAAARANSILSICETASAGRCGPMTGRCPGGCSASAPRARHRAPAIICTMRRCCGPAKSQRIGEIVHDRRARCGTG